MTPKLSPIVRNSFEDPTLHLKKLGVEVPSDNRATNTGEVLHSKASYLQGLADKRGITPSELRDLGRTFQRNSSEDAQAMAADLFGPKDWYSVDLWLDGVDSTDVLESAQRLKEQTPLPRWGKEELIDEFAAAHSSGDAWWLG